MSFLYLFIIVFTIFLIWSFLVIVPKFCNCISHVFCLYNFFHCFNIYTVHFPCFFFFLDIESSLAISRATDITAGVFYFLYINHGYQCSLKHCARNNMQVEKQPENSTLIKINCAKIIVDHSLTLVKRVIHVVNSVRSSEYLRTFAGNISEIKSDLHNVYLLLCCSFTRMIHQFIDHQCKPRNKSLKLDKF